MIGSVSLSNLMPSMSGAKAVCSRAVTNLAQRTNLLAVTFLSLYLLSSIPLASAGASAYIECIKMCRDGMGKTIWSAVICPTICAPFLAVPG